MDKIQKFNSDIQRIKKHARNSTAGNSSTTQRLGGAGNSQTATSGSAGLSTTNTLGSAAKIGEEIARLFENSNPSIRDLCRSLAGFWKEKYVDNTAELTQEAEEKIAALMAFVNNDEGTDALDSDDWARIKDEVGFAAEDLPMETLSAMMSTIVDSGEF